MEEKSTQDYECPVCTLLMAQPCSFKCSHHICIQCVFKMKELLDHVKCPLCRYKVTSEFKVNTNLQDKIKALYPKKYELRVKQLIAQNKLEGDKIKIDLLIGNRY